VSGEAHWAGRNLVGLPPRELQRVRGREVAMIFQEPGLALNPVMTIGAQIEESLAVHHPGLGRQARRARAEAVHGHSPIRRVHEEEPSKAGAEHVVRRVVVELGRVVVSMCAGTQQRFPSFL
jgi:ABC-type microcin C transport system duplicated ATPase subunit YejF